MEEAGGNRDHADFSALDVEHARTRISRYGLLTMSRCGKDSQYHADG
jgi:hypothetical protein